MDDNFTILLADDDDNDILLLQRAFKRAGVLNPIQIVRDGAQAMAYLEGSGVFVDRTTYPVPGIFVTDLKMPQKTGFEVLEWLQNHRQFRVIPTIVLSSSSQQSDIERAYALGAHCYFVKPCAAEELMTLVNLMVRFWNAAARPRARECEPLSLAC